MDQWVDSELEDDSPRSNDDIGSMFSDSPNHGVAMARGGRKGSAPAYLNQHQQFQQQRAAPYGHSASSAAATGHGYSAAQMQHMQQLQQRGRAVSQGYAPPTKQAPPPPPYAQQVSQYGGGPPPPQYSQQQQHYQNVPVRMVPEAALRHGAQQSKRMLIRRIQQDSMKMLTMTCQAVLVRGPTGNYFVYHIEITSDYYKQKWVVCKRYSEFYRLRKRLLARLAAHKKARGCGNCGTVCSQLKEFGFPGRFEMFKDQTALVSKRTAGLEEFIVALCQYICGDEGFEVCSEINSTRFMVKEFLQFPLDHECQHVRAVRNLKYVDPRDVQVDTESCPICLCEWRELDGNQLVLSPCGHFFHENCINEWYRTRFDCPMCRTIAGEE